MTHSQHRNSEMLAQLLSLPLETTRFKYWCTLKHKTTKKHTKEKEKNVALMKWIIELCCRQRHKSIIKWSWRKAFRLLFDLAFFTESFCLNVYLLIKYTQHDSVLSANGDMCVCVFVTQRVCVHMCEIRFFSLFLFLFFGSHHTSTNQNK